ncbi:hypothetical protein [Streptomyces sp. NPDC002516]
MKRGIYTALAALCGTALLESMPEERSVDPDSLPSASCAVYIAVDADGAVCYIGSVCRPRDAHGLSNHISEYVLKLPKAQKWKGLYVLPLRSTTSELEVRRITGDIVGWMIPYDRERWPRAS